MRSIISLFTGRAHYITRAIDQRLQDARIKQMKNSLVVLAAITISVLATYHFALFNFFAQDDFILINHFSQNNLFLDLRNVFLSKVTHWRPLHNLYFLIAGNVFGKNYFGYHVLAFAFHIGSSFLIYKIARKLSLAPFSAFVSSIVYGIHPAHFVSLVWISGSATIIGFFFLTASFYSYLHERRPIFLVLLVAAFLSSEATVVGVFIFMSYMFLERAKRDHKSLSLVLLISAIFLNLKLLVTPRVTFTVYQPQLSAKTLLAIKYYLLRILGFAETSGDRLVSLTFLIWLGLIAIFLVKNFRKISSNLVLFSLSIVLSGLFPFILIPEHLSPHYMNISIWGFSMLASLALTRTNLSAATIIIFAAISIYTNQLTINNNWVTKRSNLAKIYLKEIEINRPLPGSNIIFSDSQLSSSEEAYIALGGDQAIKFWFKNENYLPCFTRFEKCPSLP